MEINDAMHSDREVGLDTLDEWIGRIIVNEHINYFSKNTIEREIEE